LQDSLKTDLDEKELEKMEEEILSEINFELEIPSIY
jgi:hypothetical protein